LTHGKILRQPADRGDRDLDHLRHLSAVAILGLPIAQYPDIVPPEIVINTTYVGADAQTVEQSVATPIEQEMSGVTT